MPPLCHHILPFTYTTHNGAGPKEVHTAAAALVWLDRPFAVTCAGVLRDYAALCAGDPSGRVWLGQLDITDLAARTLCLSDSHNLATIAVTADELPALGPDATFYNPVRWPPRPVEPGEEIQVVGFPKDQWPAPLRYTFQVHQVGEHRFGAQLKDVAMPGRHEGLRGAPIFRRGREMECVGVVVDSLFHNEVIRAQHIRWLSQCGDVPDQSRIA